jgi:hypothetical protein
MSARTNFLPTDTVTNSTKFNLYLKTHEIREIQKVLRHVLLLPPKRRLNWVEENGQIIQAAFDSFIDDSNLVLEDMMLDDEALELSHELVTSLKNALAIVENILTEEQTLQS